MLFEKVEKRQIITFYFKTSTVDVGECIQPQQHWSKQFFAKVYRRLYDLPMK